MEQGIGDDSSDKDKKMKDSFESVSDDKKSEKKVEKTSSGKEGYLLKLLSAESKASVVSEAEDKEFSLVNMFKDLNKKDEEKQKESAGLSEEKSEAGQSIETTEDNEVESSDETLEPESIFSNERNEVIQTIVESELQNSKLEQQGAAAGTIESEESKASVRFYEALQHQINENQEVTKDNIGQVAQEVVGEISSQEGEASEPEAIITDTPERPENIDHEAIVEEESTEENIDDGHRVPPTPPHNNNDGYAGPEVPVNAAINEVRVNAPEQEDDDNERRARRSAAGGVLLGGIVGYLVGKRRGRIKTAKEFLPVQEKLEKQVSDIQSKLYEQENIVRRAAAENFELKHSRPVVIEKAPEKPKESVENPNELKAERPKEVEVPKESQLSKEKIPTPKAIETMSLPLLMEIAENIKIENVSLRSIFESGRINQLELREIIKQHLAGERIELPITEPEVKPSESVEFTGVNPEFSQKSTVSNNESTESNNIYETEEKFVNNQSDLNVGQANTDANSVHNQPAEPAPSNTKQLYAIAAVAVLVGVMIIIFVF